MGLACLAALGLSVAGFRGQSRARLRTFANLHILALSFAMITLITAFIVSDFSLKAVYTNSHSAKPLFFKMAGAWGNHEGSIFMWALFAAGFVALFAKLSRNLPERLAQLTLGLSGLASLVLNVFVATLSTPFARVEGVIPQDGRDLNPLLQDVGLVIHPPVLYLGYVGLIIPWALACAALILRTEPKVWAKAVKPWAFLSMAFLTSGIMLGSWWAYRELGWGGWWFWDPVENVSVLPWLLGIALAHSAVTVGKRQTLVGWSMALAILAFGATILGTFLVRSGTLVSVHAFAADPGRGIAILLYFIAIVGGGLALLAIRLPQLQTPERKPDALLSRDTAMLLQNVLILAMTVTILLGTLYPPVLQALGQAPLAIGAPYYTISVVPVMALTLGLMAVATSMRWGQGWLPGQKRLLVIALLCAFISARLTMVMDGDLISALCVAMAVALIVMAFRKRPAVESSTVRRSRIAILLAHTGVAIFALAATFNHVLGVEADQQVEIGGSFQAGPYEITLKAVDEVQGPNYIGALAKVVVNGERTLHPEFRYYPVRDIPTTEADIHTNLLRDLRVTLNLVDTSDPEELVWALRFHRRPVMIWLWIATLITSLGLMLSAISAFREP